MAQGSRGSTAPVKIKIKEPDAYDGTRDAKLLGNFCWDVEQYLDQMNGSLDEVKVNAAAMYLKGTTKLWWRNRAEDLAAGREVLPKINNWAEMKDALKA